MPDPDAAAMIASHYPALPESGRRHHLHMLCEIAQADGTLMFSSDYPHRDFDDPRHALTPLPPRDPAARHRRQCHRDVRRRL
jgi:hypothetical protein